jgi:hypothetical protein
VQAGCAEALIVRHHDREPARDHRRDEQLLVVEGEVQIRPPVDALVELTRRRALVTLALRAGAVHEQRPRSTTRPVVERLEVGTGDSHRIAVNIGAAVHDSGRVGHDHAELT